VCAVNHICATVQTITDRPSHNGCKLQFHMPWIPLSGHPHLYLRIYVSINFGEFSFSFSVHCPRWTRFCYCFMPENGHQMYLYRSLCVCVCVFIRSGHNSNRMSWLGGLGCIYFHSHVCDTIDWKNINIRSLRGCVRACVSVFASNTCPSWVDCHVKFAVRRGLD